MAELPGGTITFLFTDIEGSTRRWEDQPAAMRGALARHDVLLREAIAANSGQVFKTVGDAFYAAFATAGQALNAALAAQLALRDEPWQDQVGPLRVRMALHTGVAEVRDGDYFGPPLNRVARLLSSGHGGQVLLSQATAELVRDQLASGLGLRDLGEHALKDLQRPERIYQLTASGLPAEFPPLKTLDARPNNLPIQRSPLIGRERELVGVQQMLLREDAGLVTLIGPGGTGKTRLSLQVAAELADRFRDGVFFVPLAAVEDPGLVASTIAQALEISEMAGQAMDMRLRDYLLDKQLLLLLDNFEQVVDAAPLVADLLLAAPGLKVLVTSREVLRLQGEQEFLVPPLGLPDLRRLPPVEALSQYDAVALFIQRARLVQPGFAINNDNAPAVAEICYRLDGLPLAIELAAARIRLLTPQAILARLSSRLQFLTGGARDLPIRHQTLRSTVQWSYDLLTTSEQMLFRRLSVFQGGATLEAVERVVSDEGVGNREWGIGDGEPRDRSREAGITPSTPYPLLPIPSASRTQQSDFDLLDGLASLVDKSLLRQDTDGADEPRFVMLETIREYALELLRQSDATGMEAAAIRRAHAGYFVALVERAEPELIGHDQLSWIARLDKEQDNVRTALAWAVEANESETALRLGAGMMLFWMISGDYSEARRWLEQALEMPTPPALDTLRAGALLAVCIIAWRQNDFVVGFGYAEQSARLWSEVQRRGEPTTGRGLRSLGAALVALSWTGVYMGDAPVDFERVEEGIAILRQTGDKWGLATGLLDLGLVHASKQEYETARAVFEESRALARQVGDRWISSQVVNSLGDLARIEGDYQRARQLYEESLALYRELGVKPDIPASLHNLGYVALAQGETSRAAALLGEALGLQVQFKNRAGIAECLAGLAGVAATLRQPVQAARLFGAAEALRDSVNATIWPAEQVDYDRNLMLAREQIEPAGWDAAWAAGRAMTIQQAVAEADIVQRQAAAGD